MKLQVNVRGSWRNVVEFDPARLKAVMEGVKPLARVLGERPTWRISEDGRAALFYLQGPDFKWFAA